MPAGRLSFESVVTTVTPLINRLNAVRNSSLLTGIYTIRLLAQRLLNALLTFVFIYQLLQPIGRPTMPILVVRLKIPEDLIVQLLIIGIPFRESHCVRKRFNNFIQFRVSLFQ